MTTLGKAKLSEKKKQLALLLKEVEKLRIQLRTDEEKEEAEKIKKLGEDLKALNLTKEFDLTIKLSCKAQVIPNDTREDYQGDVKISIDASTSSTGLTEAQRRLITQGMEISFHDGDFDCKAKGKTTFSTCDQAIPYFFTKEQTAAVKKLLNQQDR